MRRKNDVGKAGGAGLKFPFQSMRRLTRRPLISSHCQNISQLEIFGDMSTPPDITSPSVSSRRRSAGFLFFSPSLLPSNNLFFSSSVFLPPDLQRAQTPASPANTLDPSQGLQPPTELFAPFNPATVPSGRTLLLLPFLLPFFSLRK